MVRDRRVVEQEHRHHYYQMKMMMIVRWREELWGGPVTPGLGEVVGCGGEFVWRRRSLLLVLLLVVVAL